MIDWIFSLVDSVMSWACANMFIFFADCKFITAGNTFYLLHKKHIFIETHLNFTLRHVALSVSRKA